MVKPRMIEAMELAIVVARWTDNDKSGVDVHGAGWIAERVAELMSLARQTRNLFELQCNGYDDTHCLTQDDHDRLNAVYHQNLPKIKAREVSVHRRLIAKAAELGFAYVDIDGSSIKLFFEKNEESRSIRI